MAFTLDLGELVSRQVREEVAPDGRVIEDVLDFFQSDSGGFLSGIGRLIGNVAGALWWAIAPVIRISATLIFQTAVSAFYSLKNFNWAATDDQLKAQLRSRNLALADAWGGAAGQLFGTISVGALGALGAMYIPTIGGRGLALSTVVKLVEERGDEVFDEIADALNISTRILGQGVAVNLYIYGRRILKNLFPALRGWGEEEGTRWSIGEAFEETIDSIPFDALREFLESFFDEFEESFIAGGFVIAGHWDNLMAQTQENRLEILGEDRAGTIALRNEGDEEDLPILRYVQLPSNLAISGLQHQMNNYRQIALRNIGEFGGDADDGGKVGEPYMRTAKIILRGDKDKPPFVTPLGEVSSRHTITLKALKPDLRWRDFKRVFRFLEWGPWRIEATLESRVTFAIYAANKDYGVQKMREIISELISEEAIRIASTIEEVDPRVAKLSKTIFPEEAIVTLKKESTLGQIVDLSGQRYLQEQIRFDLWRDDEPFGTPEFVTNYQTI
ncbi:hypothetical protein AWQ21_09640 [Picosynechococcus sp. PCC 7003]|uniref:hypothetical protein n=1 Tax=Picosynechococcus sp. PCC 7003 TaxID=374981 RepID=UPI00081081E3|nr:hypothetical protein [Picosynechococcus sp. PCC 7003]ANV84624.1 hypothetical protein AWQ21_09640 [Picosynechococcus sp. PCC 7003]